MPKFHYDFETTSRKDLFDVGAYRYANASKTRILMFAIARGHEDPVLWRFDQPKSPESREALDLMREARSSGAPVYAFNAPFEAAISEYCLERDCGVRPVEIGQYRCVQAMCRKAAIPESLAKAQAFLKLPEAKAEIGKALIDVFSKQTTVKTLFAPKDLKVYDRSKKGRRADNRKSTSPVLGWQEGTNKAILAGEADHHEEVLWDWFVNVLGEQMTVREAFDLFCEYCRQDVRVERELEERLHKFDFHGASLDSFQFNFNMNHRGIPVNVPALKNAAKLVAQYTKRLKTRFQNITGCVSGLSPKYKEWLKERGYFPDDLQADTVEMFLEEYSDFLPADALESLQIHALINFAALKKITKMLAVVCSDGYIRGTLTWHGTRTGRASGKLAQFQNVKKATMKTELAYKMICEGCSLEDFEEFWESPLEAIASCVRHFVEMPGTKFYDADYVGVEARLTPWAVGDTRKLDSILSGVCQYKAAAATVYKIPYEEVTKAQRTVGKPIELSCCFGTGGRGLKTALKDNHKIVLPIEECNAIVAEYREIHHKTQTAWKDLEKAAKAAIELGKTTSVMGGLVRIARAKTAGLTYMVIELPSKRRLYYPDAKVKPTFKKYSKEEMAEEPWKAEKRGYWTESITFYGKLPNSGFWGTIHTWGSRLFENIIQAMGADLLDQGCINAWKKGFDIFMIVHDQALCLERPDATLEEYQEALCDVGPWAKTFPLEADGALVPYYLKGD